MSINGLFVTAFNTALASELVENSWNTKTPMSQPRQNFGIATMDGKIYAIGGSLQSTEVGTNEMYDPVADAWVVLAPMPTPRANLTIIVYQDKIYCIGGNYWGKVDWWWGPALYESNAVEIYDPATDSWSVKTSAPFGGNSNFQMHVIDGKIFAIGVFGGVQIYVYDPVADEWTEKAAIPDLDTYSYSVVVGSKIIIFSNVYITNNPGYTKVMVYDSVTDIWTEKTSAPCSLSVISSGVVVADKIVLFSFGLFASDGDSPFQLGVLIYDSSTDVWSKGKSGPAIVGLEAAIVTTGVYAPQRVYVLWKQYDTTDLSNWVYDPANDTWSTAQCMLSDSSGSIAVIDDLLYVIGTSTNKQYVPIGYYGALSSKSFSLNNIHIIALIIIIGATITVTLLFFIFIKKNASTKIL